jgi:hypothetical protein
LPRDGDFHRHLNAQGVQLVIISDPRKREKREENRGIIEETSVVVCGTPWGEEWSRSGKVRSTPHTKGSESRLDAEGEASSVPVTSREDHENKMTKLRRKEQWRGRYT